MGMTVERILKTASLCLQAKFLVVLCVRALPFFSHSLHLEMGPVGHVETVLSLNRIALNKPFSSSRFTIDRSGPGEAV